jgi:hypothetical protein
MEWFLMCAIIVMFTAVGSQVNWIQCGYEECKNTSIARYPSRCLVQRCIESQRGPGRLVSIRLYIDCCHSVL